MSRMNTLWALLLGLLLLQGCATTHEDLAQGAQCSPGGIWRIGKRFRPGKPKTSTRPTKTSGPSFKMGESDGGPGRWEKAPVRPKGAGYQKEVTGAPEGTEYAVPARTPSGKVLFDGYKGGKLLDAKDWEKWPPANTQFWQDGVLNDARKQLSAAGNTPIEWHLPSEDKAEAVRELFEREDIRGITVKVTRKK